MVPQLSYNHVATSVPSCLQSPPLLAPNPPVLKTEHTYHILQEASPDPYPLSLRPLNAWMTPVSLILALS